MLLVLTVVLSACGNAMTKSSTDKIISSVYTAAALTSAAQAQISASSPMPLPVSTTTPTLAPTLIPPTAMPTLSVPTSTPIQPGFGQNSDAPVQVNHSLCDSSAYIDDVTIPDGTILAPGETFVKKWMIQNTGFCMWKTDYTLKFFEGNSMSGMDTEVDRAIASGEQAKVSVELTAPDAEGTYTGYWILADEYGNPFGMPFYVKIVVQNE
jgi:hypothetical protein